MQRTLLLSVAILGLLCSLVQAEVPQIINYQGRVVVGTTNFNGTGQFKFALVNANGTVTYWSHDGTSTAGSEPNFAAISLPVSKGLYSVLLGDTSVTNMTSYITPDVFNNPDVRLRVWFNDGTANGWQRLSPDQRIGAVGYAMQAGVAGPWVLNGTTAYYNAGNVGIGTTTPTAALELFSSDTSRHLLKLKSPAGNGLLELTSTRPTIALRDQNSSLANPPFSVLGAWDGGFRFYADSFWRGGNGLAAMAMDNAGHLGIGTLIPLSALHVSGAADALRLTGTKPYITLEDGSSFSRIQSNGFGMDFKTQGAAANNHPGLIHLNGTGIVGLGTTTPKHHLSIKYFAGGPIWTSNGWIGAIDLDNSAAIAWGANGAGQRFGMGHTNGSFAMWRTAADPGTNASPALYDFVITDSGNVGIGTTAPGLKLSVVTPTNSYGFEHTDGGVRVGSYVNPGGGWLGTLSNHPLNLYANNQAAITLATNGNVGVGTTAPATKLDVNGDLAGTRLFLRADPNAPANAAILCSNPGVTDFVPFNTANNRPLNITVHNASVRQLTIRGGADLAEPFPMAEEGVPPGAVVSIDADNPGKLKMSRSAYDKRAAGIVSGANGIKPGISMIDEEQLEAGENIALSGRVYVQANTSAGTIEPGDLLTTSDLPGEAMKAVDHQRAQGSIIGKAMTGLAKGEKGHVLVLVTLQ